MGNPLNETISYTLCFADDQIVVAQEYDDLEYMTRTLIEEYKKCGLEVNIKKAAYMCIGGIKQDLVLKMGQQIKSCDEYKYLGLKITAEGTLDRAIKDRNYIETAEYNTIVKSILTYLEFRSLSIQRQNRANAVRQRWTIGGEQEEDQGEEEVREMVPGAERKLREHKLSTEYLIRHSNPHLSGHQQYDPINVEPHISLEQYEVTECGPLLNKTPPDVCTTNRCQEFAAAGTDVTNAGALEINFSSAGASCNSHAQSLAGQTIPITIKNHNSTAPLSFSHLPMSKYGTMPHPGATLHQGFLGVSDMGSSSSNSSSGYCGKSKTLQHQRGRVPATKCVKIESFQVPEANFEGFGKQRTNNALAYSGSAV
ncbi:hypothetical protein HUJ04_008467 [Dendroctonus ponderosae]|nr:hypothetical protein HUJ04_008467 [Dendroctonus ponderosae]